MTELIPSEPCPCQRKPPLWQFPCAVCRGTDRIVRVKYALFPNTEAGRKVAVLVEQRVT
jgi:hypothetical protein